ncbi:MAG: alpha/beta fold hydrolase [Aestuariivita sp.]|nr:alpha/beta fold hydrolase [Aestuariivita sp.]
MAEAVVLIPGLMCDARVFQYQINALSASRAVMIAPAVVGERIEEMASALLDALPQRMALAGVGLGGTVAIEILRRAPERVNRIALMGVDPQADTPAIAAERDLQIVRARSGRLDDVMAQVLPPDHLAPGPGRMEVQSLIRTMAQDLGAELFVRQTRAMQRRRDYQGELRRIKVPATVMGGAEDRAIPPKRQQFMADLIPKARLHMIEDAGRMPMVEQPQATLRALNAWLVQPLILG